MRVHEFRDGVERARVRGTYADVDGLELARVDDDGMALMSTPFMVPSNGDCMRDATKPLQVVSHG